MVARVGEMSSARGCPGGGPGPLGSRSGGRERCARSQGGSAHPDFDEPGDGQCSAVILVWGDEVHAYPEEPPVSSQDQTAELVLGVIRSRIGPRGDIPRETPLFEGGLGLDSIGMLELLLEIEAVCGRRLREESLTEEAVASVGSLIAYVHALEPR